MLREATFRLPLALSSGFLRTNPMESSIRVHVVLDQNLPDTPRDVKEKIAIFLAQPHGLTGTGPRRMVWLSYMMGSRLQSFMRAFFPP